MAQHVDMLVHQVLAKYGLLPVAVESVQSGEAKAVWRVTAGGKRFALKRMCTAPERVVSAVSAQLFLRSRGMRVPQVVLTTDGEHFVHCQEHSFVLYEYVEGRRLFWRNCADLCLSAATLGEFHRLSQGCPTFTQSSTALHRAEHWPQQYAKKRERLARWKEVALADPWHPVNQAFLNHADTAMHVAARASDLLAASPYDRLAANCHTLSHQDYGEQNIILAADGPYVIDLDGVAFDLPARDLRKLVNKAMHLRAHWDAVLFRHLVSSYERQFPLGDGMRQILLIDLLFPHLFHDVAKNPYEKRKPLHPAQLVQAARLEESKIRELEPLLSGAPGKVGEPA